MSADQDANGRKRPLRVQAAVAVGVAVFVGGAAVAFGASIDFTEPASSPEPAGVSPSMVAIADLDGDADADLAVTNELADTVTVLRNNGSGNFNQPASSPEAVGDAPTGIAAVDLDGDTDLDLAVCNFDTTTVTILRNNGSGNFTEPASSPEPVGTRPSSLAAGDLDGDADVDLAVANQFSDNLTVLKNRGRGNFFEPGSSPVPVGDTPTSVVAVDMDGDADRDLAVTNPFQNQVRILRNNGAGSFFEIGTSPEPVGIGPVRTAAADLDGDADADLAVVDQAQGFVTVLKNNGSGNFFEPGSSPKGVGGGPAAAVAVDVDGDGDRDLAVTNSLDNDVSILRNNGAGGFTEPITSPELVGSSPQVLAAADLDGDSDPDLAIPNHGTSPTGVTILLNK